MFSSLLHCNLATREALSGEAAFCGVLRSCFWDRCSVSVLMNGWIICRFVEISEVSGDFLLDFALNMFLQKFTQLFHD